MQPIVTPAEMRSVDAAAPCPVEVLVQRAGSAVARAALRMMGGTYGRTVVVIAGRGNNGADGRAAAALLRDRGVRVLLVDAAQPPTELPPADLVIDAAYGTGFRGSWTAPRTSSPVLAVDIPSGVDALTGVVVGTVLRATRTVTFQAWKPGLLTPPGRQYAGTVEVADIGLGDGVEAAVRAHRVEGSDVASWLSLRPADAHKWRAAVRVVAGSTGMTGAAALTSAAAMRAGAGMVHLSGLGTLVPNAPVETVQRPVSGEWASSVIDSLHRFHSLAVGPGCGRDDATALQVRALVAGAPVPVVIDGDGLFAMAWGGDDALSVLRGRTLPTVLTPHDGEFALLTGTSPGADRLDAARRLAASTSCTVLLKGPCTVIAEPQGRVLVVPDGDERLATAGTGDVLTGVIATMLARGLDGPHAAAAAAHLVASAASRCGRNGTIASDVVARLPEGLDALDDLR